MNLQSERVVGGSAAAAAAAIDVVQIEVTRSSVARNETRVTLETRRAGPSSAAGPNAGLTSKHLLSARDSCRDDDDLSPASPRRPPRPAVNFWENTF